MKNIIPKTNTRKWKAKWIWAHARKDETNVFYYFRKTFNLPPDSGSSLLYITADSSYQLYVNGHFVGRGSPKSQPFFQYYDQYTVSDFLNPDKNCIAVLVNYIGNMPDTRGGLLVEMEDAQGKAPVTSDATWLVSQAKAWQNDTYYVRTNHVTPYQEFFDARKDPAGWKDPEFDDTSWHQPVVIKGRNSDRPPCAGPWSKLVARDIPFMTSDDALPLRVEYAEESLDLINRSRENDLAPGLSMVGSPIKYARAEDTGNLCSAEGLTVVQSSVNHREDLDFDGMYAPAIVLDFGRIITARSRLHIEGPAGGIIDIGYAERLIDGRFNIAMECEFADRYIMKHGDQIFESFAWKAFRYLKLRFRSCFSPVIIRSVKGVISTYPYRESGGFSSNDQDLNGVFDISRATIRLCSNEFLMDTPWREQAQWLGDVALVTVPAIHSCFGDTALTGKYLMQAGQNQHPTGMLSNVSNAVNKNWRMSIPDYSLWWIKGLAEHFLFSGDENLIHRLYPQALRIIDAHLEYLNEDMLIEDMPYWVFIDWADVDRRGICSAYNAIFYGVLESMLTLTQFKNDAYTSEMIQQIRFNMHESFNTALFDKNLGCYADASIDGALSDKISEHGNMTPIWAGLCDKTRARRIINLIFETGQPQAFTEAQPFYMAVVLKALDNAGRFDLALDLIRTRWGKRMLAKGATSTLEEWYQNGSWRKGEFRGFLRSHSHAWSACPADFLIRGLLGLEILEPGCRKIRVSPRETDFDYNVTFPTPLGKVEASCVAGKITISSPEKVEIAGQP